MDFDPRLYQAGFGNWNLSTQNRRVQNREGGFMTLIFGMNVRQFMPLVIVKIKANDDAVEHADGWHDEHSED
jgi:hypothetical protein